MTALLISVLGVGPVIRINPHEIHCNDPEFIDDIYAGSSRKTDKYRFTGRKTLSKLHIFPYTGTPIDI